MQIRQTLRSPDDVFVALDHHAFTEWVIEVLGVHEHDADLWVQIARDCDPRDSRLLRIMRGTALDAVLNVLAANPWLQDAPYVLRVAPSSAVQ